MSLSQKFLIKATPWRQEAVSHCELECLSSWRSLLQVSLIRMRCICPLTCEWSNNNNSSSNVRLYLYLFVLFWVFYFTTCSEELLSPSLVSGCKYTNSAFRLHWILICFHNYFTVCVMQHEQKLIFVWFFKIKPTRRFPLLIFPLLYMQRDNSICVCVCVDTHTGTHTIFSTFWTGMN